MPSFMSAYAVELLLAADTWEKKRQVLEEQQALLLAQDATDILDAILHNDRSPGTRSDDEWIAQHAYLMTYRGLLYQARIVGIRQAWAAFRMHMAELAM